MNYSEHDREIRKKFEKFLFTYNNISKKKKIEFITKEFDFIYNEFIKDFIDQDNFEYEKSIRCELIYNLLEDKNFYQNLKENDMDYIDVAKIIELYLDSLNYKKGKSRLMTEKEIKNWLDRIESLKSKIKQVFKESPIHYYTSKVKFFIQSKHIFKWVENLRNDEIIANIDYDLIYERRTKLLKIAGDDEKIINFINLIYREGYISPLTDFELISKMNRLSDACSEETIKRYLNFSLENMLEDCNGISNKNITEFLYHNLGDLDLNYFDFIESKINDFSSTLETHTTDMTSDRSFFIKSLSDYYDENIVAITAIIFFSSSEYGNHDSSSMKKMIKRIISKKGNRKEKII